MAEKKTSKEKSKISKPVWLKYNEQEVKTIILSLIKKNPNLSAEKIGLVLRDTYGIPKTRIYGFKISQVLKEAKVYKDPEFESLFKKTGKLETHISKNRGDKKTGRALIITKAKLKRIKEYLAKREKRKI